MNNRERDCCCVTKVLNMRNVLLMLLLFPLHLLHSGEQQLPLSESNYPAALTFLIADLKYNSRDGVKVCEVQQGIFSSFNQDNEIHHGNGEIAKNFDREVRRWGVHLWTLVRDVNDKAIVRQIEQGSEDWTVVKSIYQLKRDPLWKKLLKKEFDDPTKISNYRGLLFARAKSRDDSTFLHFLYPGLLFLDEPVDKYSVDKYKMNALFNGDPAMERVKAEWRCYPKSYHRDLYKKIRKEIDSDYYVIKPRGEFRGQGVIIAAKEELDSILKTILGDKKRLKNHRDPDYSYWVRDGFDSFIVERYYPSDPVASAEGGELYDPTMRITFLLSYDNEELSLLFTGCYYKVPVKSLSEEGSLNELHKSYGKKTFLTPPAKEVIEEVQMQLKEPLLLLFKKMLQQK